MKRRSFVVIGLGTFGTTIANELCRFGNHVLVIDVNERKVSPFADVAHEAIIADGRDEVALREAGVGDYDVAVVAIGEDLEANILCSMNVKMLGVDTIWAKALNKTHHRILARLDVDRILLPEQETGRHVALMLNFPLVRDYVSLGNGFTLVDVTIPKSLAGRRTGDLPAVEDNDLRLLGAMRGTTFMSCETGSVELEQDDKLLVLGRRAGLQKFVETLRGEA